MEKKILSVNDIANNMRRTFGGARVCTIAFKSKKQYNRKDKSWKRFDD